MKDVAEKLAWWHVIELPDGTVTPGKCDYRNEEQQRRFMLPKDLTGKRVLDIGTFDGFWAIEAKRRGAEVLAVDRWNPQLETAKLALGAYDIPYQYIGDLDDMGKQGIKGEYDIVLLYGVIYHLKNPWGGIRYASEHLKPDGVLLLESAVNQGKMEGLSQDVPLIWAIDVVHHGDPTNYMMFNEGAIVQLAKFAGLEKQGDAIYDSGRIGLKFRKPWR